MESFFNDCIDLLRELHSVMDSILDGLPQEALDWKTGPEMNSLAVLAAHTAGSERFWIGDAIMGDDSGRDRESEFRTKGVGAAELKARLWRALAYSEVALGALRLDDLEKERISPRDGRKVTLGWCLIHTLEHTATHVGHMQLTRQLYEQKAQI
jgi:uncharacterized damage-inducible protein DinB